MRRQKILEVLVALSVGFLLLQAILIKLFSKRNDVHIHSSVRKLKATQGLPLLKFPVKTFVAVCKEHKTPVFLIEPDILASFSAKGALTNISNPFFFNRQLVSFGVVDVVWKSQAGLLKALGKQFAVYGVTDFGQHLSKNNVTHYFFCGRKSNGSPTVIQLVVFYQWLGIYLWHGAIEPESQLQDLLPSAVKLNFSFGLSAGAYDSFELHAVRYQNFDIIIPKDPAKFVHAVAHSKFIECNHTRAKLFFSKYGFDAKENQNFQRKARQVLAKGKQLLDGLGIRFWLSSGTCLGWFRQCGIIPYSKDVDFGIWIRDYNPRLIPTFQQHGMPLKHLLGKESDSFQLSFHAGDIKLDMFFFYEEGEYMWNGATQVKTGKKFKYYFPKFTLCWTEFLELRVRVPCEVESYIIANYGTDWPHPVKVWDWKKSPPNVRENGAWPEAVWDEVIQVF